MQKEEDKEKLARRERTRKRNAWNKKNQRRFNIAFNVNTDVDIIHKLESISLKNDYLRRLIREDIRREQKEENL